MIQLVSDIRTDIADQFKQGQVQRQVGAVTEIASGQAALQKSCVELRAGNLKITLTDNRSYRRSLCIRDVPTPGELAGVGVTRFSKVGRVFALVLC